LIKNQHEEVIVRHILDLDERAFPSRLTAVQYMADYLLAECYCDLVSQNWAENFVKRTLEPN
jgi:hypothetical protein